MSARPKPGAITWPLTSDQVELIDAMFESLFSDVNNGALDITLEQIEDIETGSILIGDEDGVVSELPISTAAGAFLRTDGTTAEWSTLILPNAASQGSILYALSADNIAALAKNASATRYL